MTNLSRRRLWAVLSPHPFLNVERRLRNGWRVAIFLILLATLLVPLIMIAGDSSAGVPLYQQLAVIIAASLICQGLRRKPLAELAGAFDGCWPKDLLAGACAGFMLMALPAALLALAGVVSWRIASDWASVVGPTLAALAIAAAAEELLFRGFVFQRLIAGLGEWPAQLIIAAFFTLTHSDSFREQGHLAYLAGANIFTASILFGLAYLRTRSLALPLGLHFAANATQGPLFGYGVSGGEEAGFLTPIYHGAPDWVTGGAFGLEASALGLVCVLTMTIMIWRWPARAQASQVRPD